MTFTIPDVAFSDNTNQRTPCVLVLDGSTSMQGEPMHQLNEGLRTLEAQLKGDPLTSLRVQLLVITIGGMGRAMVLSDWCDAFDFIPPTIQANGNTPLGRGMALALQKVEEQKQAYDANGISFTRPWIIAISDGEPNDPDWQRVAEQCREAERDKKVVIFPIGTETANFEALSQFSLQEAKQLKGLNFNDLFVWLSRSMTAVSSATPGQKIQLPMADWSTVEI